MVEQLTGHGVPVRLCKTHAATVQLSAISALIEGAIGTPAELPRPPRRPG